MPNYCSLLLSRENPYFCLCVAPGEKILCESCIRSKVEEMLTKHIINSLCFTYDMYAFCRD